MPGQHGAKSSISTSAVQLSASTTTLIYGVVVKAASDNSGLVYVGTSSAVTAGTPDSTSGYELKAGVEIFLPLAMVTRLADVYVIGSAAGQKVFFLAI
jgi:hypothetical protein